MADKENQGDFTNWDEIDPKLIGRLKKIQEHGNFLKNESEKVKNSPHLLFCEKTKIASVERKLNENFENLLEKEKDRLMRYMDEKTLKDSKNGGSKLSSSKRSLSAGGFNTSIISDCRAGPIDSEKIGASKVLDEISLNTGLTPINMLLSKSNSSNRETDRVFIPIPKAKTPFNIEIRKGLKAKENFDDELSYTDRNRFSGITKEELSKLKENSFELGDPLGRGSNLSDFSSSVRTVANNNINRKIKFLDQSDRTCTLPDASSGKISGLDYYEKEIGYLKEELHKKNMEIVALKNLIYKDTSLLPDIKREEITFGRSGKLKKMSTNKIINDFKRSHLKLKNKLRNKTRREKHLLKSIKQKNIEQSKISLELDSIIDSYLLNESIIQDIKKNNDSILREINNLNSDKKLITEGFDMFKKKIEGYLLNYAEKLKKYNERELKYMTVAEENEKLKNEKEYLLSILYQK